MWATICGRELRDRDYDGDLDDAARIIITERQSRSKNSPKIINAFNSPPVYTMVVNFINCKVKKKE